MKSNIEVAKHTVTEKFLAMQISNTDKRRTISQEFCRQHLSHVDSRAYCDILTGRDITPHLDEIKAAINNLEHVLSLIFVPSCEYSMWFFSLIENILSPQDFAAALRYCYTIASTYESIPHGRIRQYFEQIDPQHIMDDEEIVRYNELPDTITAYRGSPEIRMRGLSWSLDIGQACFFADRHKNEVVYEATIDKSKVFAFFGGESEIIADVRDCDIKQYDGPTVERQKWSGKSGCYHILQRRMPEHLIYGYIEGIHVNKICT